MTISVVASKRGRFLDCKPPTSISRAKRISITPDLLRLQASSGDVQYSCRGTTT
jgi:hypothetical protein